MKKTMKINVAVPFEVEILTDKIGRRKSIMDQISPWIDEYINSLRIARLNYGDSHSSGPEDDDMQLLDRMEAEDVRRNAAETVKAREDYARELRQQSFNKTKERECLKLFGLSWQHFRSLSWREQQELREEQGVIWKDQKWVKETEEK